MRLAVVTSHPIQYQAPLFRALAERLDICVYFAHNARPEDQAAAGFGVKFAWDVDLLSSYDHRFLRNVSPRPGPDRFRGCDTPEIADELRRGSFDAVMVNGWYLKSYLQTVSAAKRMNLPVIVRGDSQLVGTTRNWRALARRVGFPLALRAFNAVLYVGERSRQYYESYGYPQSRMFFSPHCVDVGWFRARGTKEAGQALRERLGIGGSDVVVLFAGKLIDRKRPLDLVLAAELLAMRGREVTLLIAGSGPLLPQVMREASQRGVRWRSLGFCNQSEMPAVYAASDMLVLPSAADETWGLVANEALACGTPIIVSDAVGCAPDLAEDETVGKVYKARDIDELASSISQLIAFPRAASAFINKCDRYSIASATEGIVQAVRAQMRHVQSPA